MPRIVGGEVFGGLGPSQAGERHQPGRKPGVQHVLVLPHRAAAAGAGREIGATHCGAPAPVVLAVPHRDTVAPPELARDAPVADSLQPALVVVAPALGDELDGAVAVPGQCRAGQRLHPHEPLVGEPRLDHGAAAVAVAHGVAMVLHLLQQAQRLQLRHHPLPGLETVEPLESIGRREAHPRLGRHHIDRGEPVPLPDLEVGRVVRRSHLHRAGAEGRIDRFVGHHWDQPVGERQPELCPISGR